MEKSSGKLWYNRQGLEIGSRGLSSPIVGEEIARRASGGATLVHDAWQSGGHGFIDLPETRSEQLGGWVGRMREHESIEQVLVLGIGGSSLGTKAIAEACEVSGLRVSESVDPRRVRELLQECDWRRTAVVAVSKSGSTVETISKFSTVRARMVDALGESEAHARVCAVTGQGTPLRQFAEASDIAVYDVPENVGGRFSVLSNVGRVPLDLVDFDVSRLLEGAAVVRDRWVTACERGEDEQWTAPTALAADLYGLLQAGATELVMMSYVDRAASLVDWYRQLLAESLGKKLNRAGDEVRTGLTPVKAAGPVDQHSQVQLYAEGAARRAVMFVSERDRSGDVDIEDPTVVADEFDYLKDRSFGELREAERRGTQRALREAGVPTGHLAFSKVAPASVGGFIMMWELATAIVGEMLNIDAFDQPGVERGKILAKEILAEGGGSAESGGSDASERLRVV